MMDEKWYNVVEKSFNFDSEIKIVSWAHVLAAYYIRESQFR